VPLLFCDDVIVTLINKMPFSVDDKHLIKVLREEKHYTAREFLREFPNMKWSRGGLNHLLEKIDKYGCLNALPVVVDHGQRVLLKTSSPFVSLCTVKKTAHTAIILSDR